MCQNVILYMSLLNQILSTGADCLIWEVAKSGNNTKNSLLYNFVKGPSDDKLD